MKQDAIFRVEGNSLVRLEESKYESEDLLQRLIADFPGLLAGGQMDPGAPRRWVLISREIGVPDREEGHGRWSLDHLFVDQDGIPALVEVKRSSDTRLRREVVGQMLDYAANGLQYWPIEHLRDAFEATHSGEDGGPDAVLNELLGGDAEPEEFWDKVARNLEAGRVRLVFVADVIPTELQTIIEYLNERMVDTDVLAVEIKQYVGEGSQTLVPRVIGLTGRAKQKHGRAVTYDDLLAEAPGEVREVTPRLLALAEADPRTTVEATRYGRKIASVDGSHTMVMLYPTKHVEFNLQRLIDTGMVDAADDLRRSIGEIDEREPADLYPSVRWMQMLKHWERFETEVFSVFVDAHIAALRMRSTESD